MKATFFATSLDESMSRKTVLRFCDNDMRKNKDLKRDKQNLNDRDAL
ncbi:hypothetical protein A4U53_042175 (plasmid) [Rhizobium ruizarguesonis]|uniref:Uncharacterized protein n=1 Tax=Rhizobium ruizarguesonis TaxID=2081791 RepID=A0ACD5EY28_9HYPH